MYNKVIIVGNLTRDPEMKYLPSGAAVVNCGIATTHKYKDREDVLFIDITLYGRQAEVFNQYLRKGSKVLIDGRIGLEQWTDNAGQKKSKHKIIVESFKMLGEKSNNNQTNIRPQSAGNTGYGQNQSNNAVPEIDIDEDAIPF